MDTGKDIHSESQLFFYVVEFPDELHNGIMPMEVVSDSWLIHEGNKTVKCLWPMNNKLTDSQRTKIIKRHEKPAVSCQVIVNIKYKSASYERAYEKMKLLETVSSVSQSENDDESKNDKRQRKKRSYRDYVLSSSDEDTFVPSINEQANKKKRNIRSDVDFFSTHHDGINNRTSLSTSNISNNNETITLRSQVMSVGANHCEDCHKNSTLLSSAVTLLEGLRKEVAEMKRMMLLNNPVDVGSLESAELKHFPLKNIEEMEEFNKHLEQDDVMTAVSSTLQVLGGKDTEDATRRLMKKILSHEVSLMVNWSGRNDKEAFCKLGNLVQLIIGTVRKNVFCRNATQKEVEHIIKVWLRNAGDRNGGRNNRRKTNLP